MVRDGYGEREGKGVWWFACVFAPYFCSTFFSFPTPTTVDYQNRRPEFIGVFVNQLINWDKVAERYAAAGGK